MKLTANTKFITAVIIGALALSPAMALAQPIVSEATQMGQWGLAMVKALAVLVIIGGCLAVAGGRHWGGAAVALIGVIAAAKADTIASYFGI